MDALKFLNEQRRMCYSFNLCIDCPLYYITCDARPECRCAEENEDIVHKVERWSNDHPVKTRANKFLAQYPDAPKSSIDGYPQIDPCEMCEEYRKKMDERGCHAVSCLACRKEFWNEEIE